MEEPVIRRQSAVDGCEQLLEDAIVEGELSVGEKLLPERELARQLGVNRVTVRSALERLATGRLLEARQGSGHRVQDYRRRAGPKLIHALLRVGGKKRLRDVARDLLLLRRTLLGLALERAAEAASGGDRRRLADAVDRFVRTTEHTQLADARRIVFDCIVDASRSPVLTFALNPILVVIDELPELREAMSEEPWGITDAFRKAAAGLESPPKRWPAGVVAELARHDLMVLSHLPRR